MSRAVLHCGHVLDVLSTLPEASVRCCVTSPPYWRQRDYGIPGQLGLEQTPEEYVMNLVEVFREVRRVLTDDGSLFLNLGDRWAFGGHGGGGSFMTQRGEAWAHAKDVKGWRSPPAGYKDKDLVGTPWMVAFALRTDGWWLRQCNIWAKPNGMRESVRDRSTITHEYVFHLTKRAHYFYNSEAARTPEKSATITRLAQDVERQQGSLRGNGGRKINGPMKAVRRSDKQRGHSRRHAGFNDRWDQMERQEQMAHGAKARWRRSRRGTGATASTIDLNPEYLELARQRIGPDAVRDSRMTQPTLWGQPRESRQTMSSPKAG